MKRKDIEKAADEYVLNPAPEWRSGIQTGCVNERLAFIAGAEWGAKQSTWISVDERYPDYDNSIPFDERGKYIVRVECGSASIKVRYTLAWMSSPYRFNVEMDWVRVTHWMPIPPFDEKQNEELI